LACQHHIVFILETHGKNTHAISIQRL
jgi:hypothetical protein